MKGSGYHINKPMCDQRERELVGEDRGRTELAAPSVEESYTKDGVHIQGRLSKPQQAQPCRSWVSL